MIRKNILPADNHLHTRLCKHASGEPLQYLETALKKGVPAISFADHMPAPDGYDPDNRMRPDQFDLYRNMVREIQDNADIPVNYGIEADYYPGCERYLEEWLEEQRFDVVIGSVHYIQDWPFESPEGRNRWESENTGSTWKKYFDLVTSLAQTHMYDVLAHPDIPKKFGHDIGPDNAVGLALPALDAMADSGMAIEINTSGLRKPVGEIYPSKQILEAARSRNIPIAFGSDAHSPEDVGRSFDKAVTLARDSGYKQYVTFSKRHKLYRPLP